MENFSALRAISGLIKISAAITVICVIILIFALFFSNDYYLTSGIKLIAFASILVIGALVTIVQLAISEIILLFLQIEINTRPQNTRSPIAKPQNTQLRNTQPQQLETGYEWECNHCGHKQADYFIFCPKCKLDDNGLPRKI